MMSSYSNCIQDYEYGSHNLGIDLEYDVAKIMAKNQNLTTCVGRQLLPSIHAETDVSDERYCSLSATFLHTRFLVIIHVLLC